MINEKNREETEYTAEIDQMFAEIDQFKKENDILPSNYSDEEIKPLDKGSNIEDSETEEVTEELEDDQEEELEKPSEKQKKVGSKIWEQKKRTYQVLAEKRAVSAELAEKEAENLYLKQLLNDSLNAINNSTVEAAKFELDIAKANYKKAIEDSDPNALTEASVAIATATAKINDISRSSNYDISHTTPRANTSKVDSKADSNREYTEEELEIIKDWVSDHPYLDPSSSKYNKELYNQVSNFIDNKNQQLNKTNQRDQYLSEKYFDELNNYINYIKPQFYKNSYPRQNVGSTPNVGSVRNSNVSSIQGKSYDRPKIVLSALEKELCANSGGILTEKALIAEKAKELEELKLQRRK